MAEYNTSEIETYRDDVDMLSLFTADDPAIWVDNTLREVPLQLDLTDDLSSMLDVAASEGAAQAE